MANDSPTYAPMLAGTSQDVPAGDAWRFEVKWDGFRAIARVNGDDVRLWSRNGKALEGRNRSVAEALPAALTRTDCVLDGELCAFDETGVPRFELFQRGEGSIAYVVFDLLELDGEPRHRRALEPAARAAHGAARSRRADRRALAGLRRRRGAARRRAPARPGGHRRQAREVALPARPPQRRLAQDQAARGDDAADRRLHERPGRARQAGRPAARHRRPRIRRQLRQRALGRGHPGAPAAARAAAARDARRCAARPGWAASCVRASPGSSPRWRARWSSPNGRAIAGCAPPSSSASQRRMP